VQVDAGREWRGGQNQVRLLCRELASRPDVAVHLVTRAGSELARRTTGATVHPVRWTLSLDPRAVWRLAGVLTRIRPDVVHAHDAHALQAARWAMRWTYRRALPPAVVVTRRVDFPLRRPGAWIAADCVIAISGAVRRALEADGVPGGHVRVIPDGVDADETRRAGRLPLDIRHRLGLAPGTPLAVNVAALVDHKDHATLVRAAAAARSARPDLHWAIAGDGPRRAALERQINELGVTANVHLLGYIEEADALIREANVLVMSSREEGLGSVVLQALALGTPVVATRAGGLAEIVPPEWLVPVGDAAALSARVAFALEHPPAVALPERFTTRAVADAVVATYRALT
jgi:glycosyltransferase involved in cell wall biosynthesis